MISELASLRKLEICITLDIFGGKPSNEEENINGIFLSFF